MLLGKRWSIFDSERIRSTVQIVERKGQKRMEFGFGKKMFPVAEKKVR